MRKIYQKALLLLSVLFGTAMGVQAQTGVDVTTATSDKAYILRSLSTRTETAGGGAIQATGGIFKYVNAADVDVTDATYQWLIYEKDGSKYLYNLGAKGFMEPTTQGSTAWALTVSPAPVTFFELDATTHTFAIGVEGATAEELETQNKFAHVRGGNDVVAWKVDGAHSYFYIEETTVDETALTTALSEIDTWFNIGPTISEAESLLAMEGYVGGFTTDQLATLKTAYNEGNVTNATALEEAVEEVKAIASNQRIQLDASKAYTINNNQFSGSGLMAEDGAAHNRPVDESNDSYKWIIYTTNSGAQYLYNVGTSQFLVYNSGAAWTLGDTPSDLSVELVNEATSTVAYCVGSYGHTSDKGSTQYFLHSQGSNAINWTANSTNSQWLLKVAETDDNTLTAAFAAIENYVAESNKISIEIDDLNYVTYYSSTNLDFTEAKAAGMKIYNAWNVVDNQLVLIEVTNNIVDAYTGVILYAPKGTYKVSPTDEWGYSPAATLFSGTTTERTFDAGTVYVLAATADGSGVEFALLSDADGADGGNVVPANRCFIYAYELAEFTDSQTLSFTFGTPTAIESATVESDEDVTWYTLGGVAVKNPSKGIFVNSKGKVVLFK